MRNFIKKWRFFILTPLLIFIGYILGQFVPFEYLRPKVKENEINLNDYYTRAIQILGAIATFTSAFIALFKEDLKRLYEYANIEVGFKDDKQLTEFCSDDNVDSNTSTFGARKASKYEVILQVKNTGNLPARGCELHINRIVFKENGVDAKNELYSYGSSIAWKDKQDKNIVIPSTGKVNVSIFQISSPEAQLFSMPNSSADIPENSSKASLIIGNFTIPTNNAINGCFESYFSIYSESCRPVEFMLMVKWNGRWEARLAEMTSNLTIQLTKSQN